jgi:hypothetical protein
MEVCELYFLAWGLLFLCNDLIIGDGLVVAPNRGGCHAEDARTEITRTGRGRADRFADEPTMAHERQRWSCAGLVPTGHRD